MLAKIQMRRGTSAEWAAAAPVILSAGEPGYDTTLKQLRIGDGDSEWNQLSPIGALECPYDVGDIMTTINPASPALRWPGTVWASIGAGRVIVGVDPSDPDFDTVGKQGGEKTHIQTMGEMHPHGHGPAQDYLLTDKSTQTGKATPGTGWYTPGAYIKIPVQGGGQPMNIMQPYETAYRYIRTA